MTASINHADDLLHVQNIMKAYGRETKRFIAVQDVNLSSTLSVDRVRAA